MTSDDAEARARGEAPSASGDDAPPPRELFLARRGPAHVRAKQAGRHRLRPEGERDAIRALSVDAPVHPETLPMTSTAEAAIVADRLLEDVDPDGAGNGSSNGTDAALAVDGDARRPRQTFLGFLREVAVVAVVAIVIAMLVKTFLVRPFYIPSASMESTLDVGDRIIVNLLQPDLAPIGRGDVIVFTDPGGWLPQRPVAEKSPVVAIVDGALEAVGLKPSDANDNLIKRVIGVPGDHVVCCNAYGQLVINDVAIAEPYLELRGNTAASGVLFDVTVPADSLWVMGDNRYNSEDSRFHQDDEHHGFVPVDHVVGRAIVINWPLSRLGVLGNYPEVFANVPSREPEAGG